MLDAPPGLDRDGVEEWRLRIENAMLEAQSDAERKLQEQ
jgi:hypothetical protein